MWDPKLVTRNKPGIQNWLPRWCQEKFIKCVLKVFGWCPVSVHMLYWCWLDHVWALSEPCLDIVWTMSGWCLDYVWTVSGRCLEHKICLESFWTSLKCVWNLSGWCWTVSGACLHHVWTESWTYLDCDWNMSGWCPCQDHGLCGLVSSQCWDVSVTCLELVWSLSVRPSNNSSLSGI